MKFVSILSIFLLYNSCFSDIKATILANIGNDPPIDRELQPSIPSGTVKPKTTFIDLDADVLFLIFTEFDFHNLLNVTKAIPEMLPVAQGVFRRKYKNYIVRILQTEDTNEFYDNFNETRLDFYAFQASVDVLEIFGPVISKLEVRNRYIPDNHSATLSQIINKHCAESLNHLNLHFIKRDTLQQFTVPFSNVETLIFFVAYDEKQIKGGNLSLSELFPKVDCMRLGINANINYNFIECKFPNLVDLFVYATNDGLERIDHITELVKKNPQICYLDLQSFPYDYIQTVNKYLQSLENLKLGTFGADDDSVHFQTVKHFKVGQIHAYSLDKLSFSRLESFEFNFQAAILSDCVEFFERHQSLMRLDIGGWEAPLVQLTANLPNLVIVNVQRCTSCSVEIISQFFVDRDKLMKFQFTKDILDSEERKVMRERFANEWLVEDFENGLLFERRV